MIMPPEAEDNFRFSFEGSDGVAGEGWRMKRLQPHVPKLDAMVEMNVLLSSVLR
jgi:hypothetical protein